ncbi:hypothetical protein NWP21_18120 [Anabaenopsis sp. FSS-46]|uniref:hypothetical protein n=1 Tax=Anabaenopsis sp. FSS-46 TaxID=2971766 RepID=UPI002472F67E|nr:hypothetical protein [Anabaenopsis sp. FSS-46]MDH6100716.1 hypothetical protein [Anabaenopsis sp. FSS-46]
MIQSTIINPKTIVGFQPTCAFRQGIYSLATRVATNPITYSFPGYPCGYFFQSDRPDESKPLAFQLITCAFRLLIYSLAAWLIHL